MKKLVVEQDDGMESLLGQNVTLFCMNYIYTGKLVGVNDTCVLIKDPKIVYETGSFSDSEWQDAQGLPHDLYIQICSVEAFGVVK